MNGSRGVSNSQGSGGPDPYLASTELGGHFADLTQADPLYR